MTARTVGIVRCDHVDYDGDGPPRRCPEAVRTGRRASEAREAARQRGWDVGEGRHSTDFCPVHIRSPQRALNQKEAANA